MAKRTKVSKSELAKLQEVKASHDVATRSVTTLSVVVADASKAFDEAVVNLRNCAKDYQDVWSAIEKRYGNVNVDIVSGTITEVEDDNQGDS